MVPKKAPFTKDLLTDIQKSWNHFNKEYWFKLVKSLPERIKVVSKAWEATMYFNFFFLKEFHNFFLNIELSHNILFCMARKKKKKKKKLNH